MVMDMPETCCDCRFCRELHEGVEACCELEDEPNDNTQCRMIDDYCYHKPDWCFLRELPERKEELPVEKYEFGGLGKAFVSGWNTCLDKILKEGRSE